VRRLGPNALPLLWVLVLGTATCQAEPRVIIATSNGSELTIPVEIADTPAKRELGLQYRRDLGADRGMIFVFPAESMLSFWMKNTPIPLDMIFIGGDHKIVGIVEQAPPFTLDPRGVPTPSKYVLEVHGGFSKRHGVRAGDIVRFENISADRVTE
jgi:uncharacterized membrane protein (UPF0127 family)